MRSYFLWLAKFLTVLAVFLVGIPFLMVVLLAATQQNKAGEIIAPKNKVAVVELLGPIMDSKEVIEKLYEQIENEKVKAIVLRIDSPGGAVGPSQEIYETVKYLKTKKPIVASLGTVAASGGFYAAVGASKVFCQRGTLTGSVGVIMQFPNVQKAAEGLGIGMVTLKSGGLKDAGNIFREMTPEEQQYLQQTLDRAHEQFVAAVAEGRGVSVEDVKKVADGRILLGEDAKALKLVDEFGTVYDAARSALELAGLPLKEGEVPDLLYTEDRFRQLQKILESVSGVSDFFNVLKNKALVLG